MKEAEIMHRTEEAPVYIVAGDEMRKLMNRKLPGVQAIPFRDDLSKGSCHGCSFDSGFIADRASFWGVSEADYAEKMSPIIQLDLSRRYILCFGKDDCCKANLRFMLGYFQRKGYTRPVHVRIVDEYDLTLLEEYDVDWNHGSCCGKTMKSR